ncbi:MAG TPA: hypothetical protein VGB17_06430 [Pyrinomonadaceae bacterium]|jgi:F0F1-type ATP synthase membrane subunit c/vacuolar-type H+-ATPase subunit K
MKRRFALKVFLIALAALLALFALSSTALGQCAMCRAVVSGAADNKGLTKGLNLGVLVLLVPPVTIFCSIFIVAFKHRKAHEKNDER